MLDNMHEYGISPGVQDQITRCVNFHGIATPCLFLGVFMVDNLLDLLEAEKGEKLFAIAETYRCLPDPVQVIAGCTFGNHRLQVIQIGKFAITMYRPSKNPIVEGFRVYVDINKMKKYHLIHLWYTRSPLFDSDTMVYPLIDEILKAGRDILSSQRVLVTVPVKKSWKSVLCSSCGELVPDWSLEDDHCGGCGSMSYYGIIS
jgi:formylmethanofuran dehydrogenase subunit E